MQPLPPDTLRSLMTFILVQLLTEAYIKHVCRVASMLRNEQVPAGAFVVIHWWSCSWQVPQHRHRRFTARQATKVPQQGISCEVSLSVLWCLPATGLPVDEPLPLLGATFSRAEYADMYCTYVLYISYSTYRHTPRA